VTALQSEPDGPLDAFISYSSDDVAQAVKLQAALEAAGLSVWRDHVVPTISRALRNAAAVVVLWSDSAAKSRWVQKEADYAEVAGKFLPLAVEGFKYATLDPVFRDYNCGSCAAVQADPADFARRVRELHAAAYAGLQIRHPDIRPVRGFAGRDEMLGALETVLWQGGTSAVAIRNAFVGGTVALRGLGGVGKTVLARQYAWEQRTRHHGVWWLRADAPDKLLYDLIALGRRLGLNLEGEEAEEAARKTLDGLAQGRTQKPWLLVYDNVDDKALVRRFTPSENAHVIYTTRLQHWFGEAEELAVDVFPRDDAIGFLLSHAPNEPREAAGRLVDALGCLPLALAQARTFCKTRHKSFDAYRERLTEFWDAPKYAGAEYPETVFATFSIAMDRIAVECAAAWRLMALTAHFAPDQIPLWLIPETILPEAEREDALEALQRLSLVESSALGDGGLAISVHGLVQEVMRARLRNAGEAEGYAAKATRIINEAYDDNETFAAASHNADWLPHASAILAHAPCMGDDARRTLWICNQIGDFCFARGELSHAKQVYETGMKIALKLADANPENTSRQRDLSMSLVNIGDVQRAQGDLSAALKSYQGSHSIMERLAQADPHNARWQRDLSVSHNKIGEVQRAQGDLSAALKSYQASLAIIERLTQADPYNAGWQRDLALSYGRVGTINASQRRITVARTQFYKGRNIIDKLMETSQEKTQFAEDLMDFDRRIFIWSFWGLPFRLLAFLLKSIFGMRRIQIFAHRIQNKLRETQE
jgi:tetratricopeptide (TPR) repeat protein